MKKRLWMAVGIICVLGVVLIGMSLVGEKEAENEQQDAYEVLQEAIEKVDEEPTAEEHTAEEILEEKYLELEKKYEIEIPRKNLEIEEIQETSNEDIYAWIYVPGTMINYPIVQHPNDDTYYLNRNLDGSVGYPGCIYSESYNQKDFSDAHTVLYGHNMKNGTMFGSLHQYEDSEFFEQQPFFYIYTEDDIFVYQIFRAYRYTDEHLLLNYTTQVEVGFEEYLNSMREYKTLIDNVNEDLMADLTAKDKICTLSTCIKNQDDFRYLVQGVLCDAE